MQKSQQMFYNPWDSLNFHVTSNLFIYLFKNTVPTKLNKSNKQEQNQEKKYINVIFNLVVLRDSLIQRKCIKDVGTRCGKEKNIVASSC